MKIIVYISAANDMEIERELLGRAIADVPVDLNWQVIQSPRKNEPIDTLGLNQADIHLLLLGEDIRAPIGLEYLAARRARRRPLLFLKMGVHRTPAASNFVHFVSEYDEWHQFENGQVLRKEVLGVIGRYILDHSAALVLSPVETERLKAWLSELDNSEAEALDIRGGAGESSLLLSRKRFEPSGGVLLEDGNENSSSA